MNKRIRNTLLSISLLTLSGVVVSCGKSQGGGAGKESKAAIDSAVNLGREAARKIIMREWKDSMQFQNAVLEATAIRSKYHLEKRPEAEEAFDSAFVSTIRTTRPDLANHLR